jgi:hypothetical protein
VLDSALFSEVQPVEQTSRDSQHSGSVLKVAQEDIVRWGAIDIDKRGSDVIYCEVQAGFHSGPRVLHLTKACFVAGFKAASLNADCYPFRTGANLSFLFPETICAQAQRQPC